MNRIAQTFALLLALAVLPSAVAAQNFPPNGEVSEELAIGGPSIDYLTLEFPRSGVAQCAPFTGQTRSVGGDLTRYGKALLVVIFPKDCPYCIAAADAAETIIAKYRDRLTVWYANQRLNGDGSCSDITEMANKYTFVRNADFRFIDVYMWNNAWSSSWHYGSQDSYWSRKESPSVYRIFNPRTRKVTGIDYNVGPIESQILAAIADNQTVSVAGQITSPSAGVGHPLSPAYDRAGASLVLHTLGAEPLRVEVVDARGRTVAGCATDGASAQARMDLGHLPDGTYVVRYRVGAGRSGILRFVKN